MHIASQPTWGRVWKKVAPRGEREPGVGLQRERHLVCFSTPSWRLLALANSWRQTELPFALVHTQLEIRLVVWQVTSCLPILGVFGFLSADIATRTQI